MNFETITIWCWLIPVIVGAICGVLGYSIGKGPTKITDNTGELDNLRVQNTQLQAALDSCNKKVAAVESTAKTVSNTVTTTSSAASGASTTSSFAFNAATAKSILGKVVKQDDLKVVEGIGPKIEGMFKDNGIKTWKALSEASVAECQKVLDKGGKRYQIHDPASWPMQAKMCYEGKWDDLHKWQEEHKHGKL